MDLEKKKKKSVEKAKISKPEKAVPKPAASSTSKVISLLILFSSAKSQETYNLKLYEKGTRQSYKTNLYLGELRDEKLNVEIIISDLTKGHLNNQICKPSQKSREYLHGMILKDLTEELKTFLPDFRKKQALIITTSFLFGFFFDSVKNSFDQKNHATVALSSHLDQVECQLTWMKNDLRLFEERLNIKLHLLSTLQKLNEFEISLGKKENSLIKNNILRKICNNRENSLICQKLGDTFTGTISRKNLVITETKVSVELQLEVKFFQKIQNAGLAEMNKITNLPFFDKNDLKVLNNASYVENQLGIFPLEFCKELKNVTVCEKEPNWIKVPTSSKIILFEKNVFIRFFITFYSY